MKPHSLDFMCLEREDSYSVVCTCMSNYLTTIMSNYVLRGQAGIDRTAAARGACVCCRLYMSNYPTAIMSNYVLRGQANRP